MPTTKARINISVPDEVREMLHRIAKRDRVPEATKAARLLEIALELEEDQVWNDLALARDKRRVRFVPHGRAWR